MKKHLLLISIISLLFLRSNASIIHVPADYAQIQTAINAAISGDSIIVDPGTYYENLNFRGKNIFLSSLFYVSRDTDYIQQTIINGSQSLMVDTGSCVIFNSGEDSTATLQGFTITGGNGTIWTDIHGAGNYREGAGILIELSSPTICFNRIIYNNAIMLGSGITSCGGGGIRISDGNPKILNNVIAYNTGRYGAGIVLNYTAVTIKNNLIAFNIGGQDFGGGGIWASGNFAGGSKLIENNTIVNNQSFTPGGGIRMGSTAIIVRNNIIWGNIATTPATSQISAPGTFITARYNDIQGGYNGNGNINLDPFFVDNNHFWLTPGTSNCIDAGDSSLPYNDVEDLANLGNALLPALGLLRNDIGAYGGQGAQYLPAISGTVTGISSDLQYPLVRVYPNPSSTTISISPIIEMPQVVFLLDDYGRMTTKINTTIEEGRMNIDISQLENGIYFLYLKTREGVKALRFIKN